MREVACLICWVWVVGVRGFPDGAPFDTCLAMFPKHKGFEQTTSPAPFSVSLSAEAYTPNQNVTVTVSSTSGHMIRGIQMRAHRTDVNREESVGRFVLWPDDKIEPINCFGQTHSMITHSNNDPRSEISLVWRAPEKNIGPIVFKVTLVEDFQTFWSQLSSPRLEPKDLSTVEQPNKLEFSVTTSFEAIDWTQCGKTKGCLLYPRHCSGVDCYAAVSFQRHPEGHGHTFEMVAEGEGYVSLGFSHDKKMGDDQTITCTAQGERVTVQNGYNHKAMYNERMLGLGLTELQTMQQDGKVYCRFTRPRAMDVIYMPNATGPPDVFTFDLSIDFYLFLAWGYTYHDSDALKMHKELPVISDYKINFNRYAKYRGSSVPMIPRIHACLMVAAWMAVAGMTVVLSRYFKDGMGANMCLAARAWFQLHRTCAALIFGLTAAGLAVILAHFKGKITEREEAYNHAVVGFSLAGGLCGQIVVGMLRPSLFSKFRTPFKICHRLLGKSLQILSAATLMLAFQWEWMPRVMREFGQIVMWTWIAAQVTAELLLEAWLKCCSRRRLVADINLNDVEPSEKQLDIRQEPSCFPIALYFLFAIAAGTAGLCTILLF